MVAGQTAPGDGICLSNCPLKISTHDVVVRFLRSRPGDGRSGYRPDNRDALEIASQNAPPHNIVIDHCSFSWAIDENISTWYPCRDISIQWCISSEALLDSLHPKGPHGMGFLLGDGAHRVSIHHNLFAHNNERNPLLKANTSAELVNNVIYNWGKVAVHFSNYERTNRPIVSDVVGNIFKFGPNSGQRVVFVPSDFPLGSQLHVDQNLAVSQNHAQMSEWKFPDRQGRFLSEQPHLTSGVFISGAARAYGDVVRCAGASLPSRDAVDRRVVDELQNGTGRIADQVKQTPGYPEYGSAETYRDSDGDGLSDTWEREHGLDPLQQTDGRLDRDGDGYTNAEEFLNSMVPASLYSQ